MKDLLIDLLSIPAIIGLLILIALYVAADRVSEWLTDKVKGKK